MVTYILLVNWTDQGTRAIKDSTKRLDAGRALAKNFGCEIKEFYLTLGPYDMICRGRDARYRAPPAQNPACGIPAPGSHLG